VATTDFLTPVVDDPYTWGRIAAQNAASDVYAMGGRPLFALNLVAWPSAELPTSLLVEVLAGGAEIARRRRLVPPGHLVEAWQDLRIPDRFWLDDEAKALLDATGAPLPVELSLDAPIVMIDADLSPLIVRV